jgi:hypothetical protein
LYYKTKIVKTTEMDFSAAREFDDQDLVHSIATEDAERNNEKNKHATWIKRAQYMVFG